MATDWYPTKINELDTWHATFNAQVIATGASHGLTAGAIAQVALDNTIVGVLVDYEGQIRGYLEAWTQYRDIVLSGDKFAPLPAPPTAPTLTIPLGAYLPGIEGRTRDYANIIKANLLYTPAIGEDYGIVGPAAGAPGTPTVKATAMPGSSNVTLKIGKAGYDLLAIDLSVSGGPWVEIQRVNNATYTDTTGPVAPSTPEQRNYRVQGVVNSARVGDLSTVASVVTTP